MSGVKSYVLSVTAAAIWINLCSSMVPEGKYKRYTSFLGSTILILAILSPIIQIRDLDLRIAVQNLQPEQNDTYNAALEINDRLMHQLISEQCEAYILDKATALGAELNVTVTTGVKENMICPVSVILEGTCTVSERKQLADFLEGELGIPYAHQEWNIN